MNETRRNVKTMVPEARRLAVDLQDEVLAADGELERLQRILDDAAAQLFARFSNAHAACRAIAAGDPAGRAVDELQRAMTALQFQDLSAQLLAHARQRLSAVAGSLASLALPDDEGCELRWPTRACPVAQRALDAGSVELF